MFRTTMVAAMLLAATPVIAQTGARVEVNGIEMYYEISGDGPPLIVLHGAYMNIPTMGQVVPDLAETNTVYALEFQGHGRTTDIDRPITYENLAEDVIGFMDAVGIDEASLFGYSLGANTALRVAIDHPERVQRAVLASVAYDLTGWQPAYQAFLPQLTPDMFVGTPIEDEYRRLSPNPEGFAALVDKLIALEHLPLAWEADVATIKTPMLIIQGDADTVTLEHSVQLFKLLGGGVMGDMGVPLPASRLAILPATSHTALINQPELLKALIEPFLRDEATKAAF